MQDIQATPLPAIFVGREVIKDRVTRYQREKQPLLTRALHEQGIYSQETKSIWYSREHVETWLKEMDLMDADGMRIYLGAYGKEEGRPEGQLCLLMVLTRADEEPESHNDIILEEEPGFEERKASVKSRAVTDDIFSGNGLPKEYNYGSPCPPICPPKKPYFDV